MQILHIGTYYGLFISLLLPNIDVKKCFFFIASNMKVNIDAEHLFYMEIKKLKFPFSILYYDFYLKYKLNKIVKEKKLDTNLIIGQDHIIGKDYFLNYNYHLVEDGLGSYTTFYIEQKRYKKRYVFNKILGRKSWNGTHENVKKIYFTRKDNISPEIVKKAEFIDLKELWKNKTEKEKKEILNIFFFDINEMKKVEARKYILFTQPLSEDSIISEEEKIELYRRVLDNYNNKKVIIKTHPREKTDYTKIFKDVFILNNQFPAELLSILNIHFDKVITLFSTAVMIFEDKIDIDFYGTEVHPKLLERFGTMENVIKRNKFLDNQYRLSKN